MFKKFVVIIAAVLVVGACASTQPRTFSGSFTPPPANSRVLLMTPDVTLSMLTAAGIAEARADWSSSAQANLESAIVSAMQVRSHTVTSLDPNTAMEGRQGQIIRLHNTVGSSIVAVDYMGVPLPTRRGIFEWTLGEGAQELGQVHNVDYALFVSARGSYASSGRVMVMIGMAALGASVPLGGQQAFASLVDLRTGNIIWFNVATATPGQDMRDPEGATALVNALLSEVPL